MKLNDLYHQLSEVFDGTEPIEAHAKKALLESAPLAQFSGTAAELPAEIADVMTAPDAHPICRLLARTPLPWAPPGTSDDKLYIRHSDCKAHVELVGPDGLVESDQVRLGLYGMLPESEYGIRTHAAEEIYIMLAGSALWKVAELPYIAHGTGERSFHPSMIEHGTRTAEKAFMSVYVWHGDISTDSYVYTGK
ncbi:hypothetical protein AB833_26270 [Chromatiales bacterium (ex Bugula neritina AB1)]|nr:hypothetical protein AB833_26270 [Chromatiales bacterium (ex Bugula neritina AB1)]